MSMSAQGYLMWAFAIEDEDRENAEALDEIETTAPCKFTVGFEGYSDYTYGAFVGVDCLEHGTTALTPESIASAKPSEEHIEWLRSQLIGKGIKIYGDFGLHVFGYYG